THYTIGQRKGLNLAMGHPVFVAEIRPETNEVVIGENEDIHTTVVYCNQVNYMAMEDLQEPRRALVKIRYAHKGSPCLLEKQPDGSVKCTFDEPVRAATPGQAAVFYEDGYVLGGGTIL
ncbi:MAG: aminomethyltransferase beta-barrel domain-containing protein, partial [Lachnospiraceae bacterium]